MSLKKDLPSPRTAASLLRMKLNGERQQLREQAGRIASYKRELATYSPEQLQNLTEISDDLGDAIVKIDSHIRELDNLLR
jgi:uncharacterized protein YbjQ (UPF0145 family)